MSKKRKKKNERKNLKPKSFRNFQETVTWLKKSVYFIARGRKQKLKGKEIIKWIPIGTGFLAGDGRMVTAAHVINNFQTKLKIAQHKDGDLYYFIKHDESNDIHWSIVTDFKLDKSLFVIPEIDLAVFYLSDSFYCNEKETFLNRKDDIIPISLKKYPLGTEIGVLGYPLVDLKFKDHNVHQPLLGDILLRADKGVINCRYNTSGSKTLYEFTLNFNPGNSGGPIFHTVNGYAISIVHGFRNIVIDQEEIATDKSKNFTNYKENYFINGLSTRYSQGISTSSMKNILEKHNIEIKE